MTHSAPKKRTAIIIGAGPAGLTAALELLRHSDIHPIVLEKDEVVGGISRTIQYKGNRLDIGGHRFFSRSDRIMNWWLDILPLEDGVHDVNPIRVTYHNQSTGLKNGPLKHGSDKDQVMLVRPRKSRILFRGHLLNYPLQIRFDFLRALGFSELTHILVSYIKSSVFPRPEATLEDFYVNRFGYRLYSIFFRDYTEKVWGQSCSSLSAEWGAQRVKALSIGKTIYHALRQRLPFSSGRHKTETSLIEQFLYPKFGPGQMWENVASEIIALGGEIHFNQCVKAFQRFGDQIVSAEVVDTSNQNSNTLTGDYFLSTMPIRHFVRGLSPAPPEPIFDAATQLPYRDFITVGLLVKELSLKSKIKDQWIYIQDSHVYVGRIQIFNNWSPAMVANPDTWWLGLEYFCNSGDTLWTKTDEELIALARQELAQLGVCRMDHYIDGVVVRMPKAYPVYSGSYEQFHIVRDWLDQIENLYPIGRNGMHRYNNQDHSMLTAMEAVHQITNNCRNMDQLWNINTEDDYHESK